MERLHGLIAWWNRQPLLGQFLFAGGLVSLACALLVGAFVTSLIERAVTHNSGVNTALYVDSIIAPLLPDMRTTDRLDDSVVRALDETLGAGALGDRLRVFRLWRRDGTLLYSNEKQYQSRIYPLNEGLKAALAGQVVAEFDDLDDDSMQPAQAGPEPLLEIYNPVRQPWSGEVVAVSEFYEDAGEFRNSLAGARWLSWIAVVLVTILFFLALSAIVLRGSRTIDRQSRILRRRVGELSRLLARNKLLARRLRRASQRASELNERHLRRIGADLHDGPAQLIALAALRLDGVNVRAGRSSAKRNAEIATIRQNLDEALREIRTICSGLVLPQIEAAELPEIIERAVAAHEQRTGATVCIDISGDAPRLPPAAKTCIYRFVQEGLNNGWRHGEGRGLAVRQAVAGNDLTIEVSDSGPGFDPAHIASGCIGLAGLRERVESLGGRFGVDTTQRGTRIWMAWTIRQAEEVKCMQSA